MKSLRSSSGDFVQKADWQAALNWLTFCSSVKRGLPIIAPAHQRQSNTRLDDSGYAEHWWKDDESEKRGVLWRSETISTVKWDSFLKLAWKQAIGWKRVIECFGRFQKNSLKGVQCAMPTHTRDVIFSFIDFLPEFELLLFCGNVCEFRVCVSFLVCVVERDWSGKNSTGKKERMNATSHKLYEKNMGEMKGRQMDWKSIKLFESKECVCACLCMCVIVAKLAGCGWQFGAWSVSPAMSIMKRARHMSARWHLTSAAESECVFFVWISPKLWPVHMHI